MEVKLSFNERKWLLKCYWKVENVFGVHRRWSVEFGTPPPTRVTIARIRVKFEVDGTVQDVLKGRCGRKGSSTDNENADAIKQVFALISQFNPSWLLPLWNFKEHGVRHKTTNTGGTERSDWTCHQWYSMSNNPYGM